ncbi:hypothetical protein AB6813_11900 [bacterium RCC_150]
MAAGSHTLSAVATDLAGNIGASSPGTQVTIHPIAPTVTINQAADQTDPTTGTTVDFTVVVASENIYGLAVRTSPCPGPPAPPPRL